jgi:RNA-splicing ligase RtcB
MKTIDGYDVKIFTDNVEDSAIEQIKELLSIDVFSDKKIRIMPDVHSGAGCVIGFTGDLGDKVIPNIVGVDIGCGMIVCNLGKIDIKTIDFHALNEYIKENIPSGMNARDDEDSIFQSSLKYFNIRLHGFDDIISLYCKDELKNKSYLFNSIGTLGGGNHFIELDKDNEDNIYIVVHTGSRNLGKQVAEIYQRKAIKYIANGCIDIKDEIKKLIIEYREQGRVTEINDAIKELKGKFQQSNPNIPESLCYLEGVDRDHYLHDMKLCQEWAKTNRRMILYLLCDFFGYNNYDNFFESVHNYIDDDNVIRKGAISAKEGEECIIPINMRDGSLICKGKGNPDWNNSAPHGAGRVMSRTKAYDSIKIEDFQKSMDGIYSESVNQFTIDESPMVYKPIEDIVNNIGDTVDIIKVIKPIFNFKASE